MQVKETVRQFLCPLTPKRQFGKIRFGHKWAIIEGYAMIVCRECLEAQPVTYYTRATKEGQAILFHLISKGTVHGGMGGVGR